MQSLMTRVLATVSVLGISLSATPAQAFVLSCKADISKHIIYGKTSLECTEPKTGIQFESDEFEIGPGLRFTMFSDDEGHAAAKYVAITCPLMGKKRLKKMAEGSSLKIGGFVADVNMLVGVRFGIGFGKPGICFVTGASAFELGGEVAVDGMKLTKVSSGNVVRAQNATEIMKSDTDTAAALAVSESEEVNAL